MNDAHIQVIEHFMSVVDFILSVVFDFVGRFQVVSYHKCLHTHTKYSIVCWNSEQQFSKCLSLHSFRFVMMKSFEYKICDQIFVSNANWLWFVYCRISTRIIPYYSVFVMPRFRSFGSITLAPNQNILFGALFLIHFDRRQKNQPWTWLIRMTKIEWLSEISMTQETMKLRRDFSLLVWHRGSINKDIIEMSQFHW